MFDNTQFISSIDLREHQQQLLTALAQVNLPPKIIVREWNEADFSAIQQISGSEGWTSPTHRPADSLLAWQNSWPALVAVESKSIIGFIRGLTDGAITMYIADLAVDQRYRNQGIGRVLLEVCHYLYPAVRVDLLAADPSQDFYKACGFKVVHDGMRKSYL